MSTLTTTFSFIPNSSSSRSSCLKTSSFSILMFPADIPVVRRGNINNKVIPTASNMTTKMVKRFGFSGNGAAVDAAGGGGGGSSNAGVGGNDDEGVETLERKGFVNKLSHFISNDLQSFINNLSKWLVGAVFITLILWRREPEYFWAALGSMVNTYLSFALKRILNQERPFSTVRSDPGMPSSHAQSIFYTTFFILTLVKSQGANGLTFVVGGLILALGSYLSWLRVTYRLHSPSQVIVGATLGSAFSMLWFWSWGVFVLKAYTTFSWVRIFIILCAVGYNLNFLIYLLRHGFKH